MGLDWRNGFTDTCTLALHFHPPATPVRLPFLPRTGIANNGWSFAFYTIWNYTALTILFLLLVLHSLVS